MISASPRHARGIRATAELLTRLRLQFIFLGNVTRSAVFGVPVSAGSIDVLALMAPEQKNQVAMMASNRGFRVDRDEIERSEELDLVPLTYLDAEGDVRVHVLVASNALYAAMIGAARPARFEEIELRVPSAEDLALLLTMAEDLESVERLIESDDFDRKAYNERLVSIGLREIVIE